MFSVSHQSFNLYCFILFYHTVVFYTHKTFLKIDSLNKQKSIDILKN